MLKTDSLSTALLVHSLLHTPDGPAFEETVRHLHTFLQENGAVGQKELRDQIYPAIFGTLCDVTQALEGEEALRLPLHALQQYQARHAQWLKEFYVLGEADVNTFFRVQQEFTLMTLAATEEEVDSCFRRLDACVLQQDGILLGDCLPLIERCLTDWLADSVEALWSEVIIPTKGRRAVALFRLLEQESPIKQRLAFITSYNGELFFLTEQSVHALGGKEGKAFLKRELDRLSLALPLLEFFTLISSMSNQAPEGNPVSQEVLNSYCGDLQAMFTPVR